MNITVGIAMICLAVVMIYFAIPTDGVSHRYFKGPWIVGQLYVMTAMLSFVMGGAAILGNI
jgi:hypothetical protein